MSELQPIAYKARRYQAGSSNAEAVSIVVSDDEFHLTDSSGAKIVVPMHDVSLKLGGSSSDRVVLDLPGTGDTVIVNDLDFLKVVKNAQGTSVITKQVKRAETARTINKLQGFVFAGVVLGSIMLFGGCLFVALILEPDRESKENTQSKSATSTQAPSSTTAAQSSELMKVENAYQTQVKKILLDAWPTPPKKEYGTVVVEIKLSKNGTVMASTVKESSNNKQLDASAIAAVNKSSPLPAPPQHWTEPIILDFTFNPLDKVSQSDDVQRPVAAKHQKKNHKSHHVKHSR